jgi:hypothetical protein
VAKWRSGRILKKVSPMVHGSKEYLYLCKKLQEIKTDKPGDWQSAGGIPSQT